jgi:hypothetical protein
MKSRRIGGVRYTGTMMNAYQILYGNLKGRDHM